MNSFRNLFTAFVLMLITQPLFSQAESFGTWTDISVEKELTKKWNIEAETELRTIYYVRLIERWSLGLSTDFSINKHFDVALGYDFQNKLDLKYLNYQFRNRFNASGTGKWKFNDFTFSLREKVQVTAKDDSNRLDENGVIDSYKVNPEWSWRNKLEISYNIPNFKINPSFSVESFYQLNNPDGNTFDNLRYILSFDYKLNKRNKLEVYGVYNSSLDSDDAYGKYILGVGYKITLK